jgi:1-acyl-sn-glycerol-3-phosphate acyltransferase
MKILYALMNFAQALFLFVWSACWISLALVASLFSRELPLWMARRCWAPALIYFSGARMEVAPLPDIDWKSPHIFIMNHQSMLDIACAFAYLPANLRFVAKHNLKYIPFLGWFMWRTKMIFVDRGRGPQAMKSLRRAAQQIRQGANIIVYPEGSRSRTGEILPFKKGAFVLALEAGVPLIPVAIEGSRFVAPPGSFAFRPARVQMKVGAPIVTEGRSPADREAVAAEVREVLVRLHVELSAGSSHPPAREAGLPRAGHTSEV